MGMTGLWGGISTPLIGGAAGNLWYGSRGLNAGAYPAKENIDYWNIDSTGNASTFGVLTASGRGEIGGCSNAVRGLFWGGSTSNIIDYVTIASTGNATDFGDMTYSPYYPGAMASEEDRGVAGGGITPASAADIDYVTISTTGNASDFGDLQVGRYSPGTASNGVRGVFACGGPTPTYTNNSASYITFANAGSQTATYFGDMTLNTYGHLGCSSDATNDRGVFAGSSSTPTNNTIDYITIGSTGNATDFGDLTVGGRGPAGTSNGSRGCYAGGHPGSRQLVIDYVTIMSAGNATDFGDLTETMHGSGGCSGDP